MDSGGGSRFVPGRCAVQRAVLSCVFRKFVVRGCIVLVSRSCETTAAAAAADADVDVDDVYLRRGILNLHHQEKKTGTRTSINLLIHTSHVCTYIRGCDPNNQTVEI